MENYLETVAQQWFIFALVRINSHDFFLPCQNTTSQAMNGSTSTVSL